jgi:hypothetical protein
MASADIPLLISAENASSERRITPSWTIAHLKGRLEPITGVPASSQRLVLKVASQTPQPIEAADEESTPLARWPLQAYAEIQVGRHVSLLIFSRNSPCFHWEKVICTNRGHWSSCFALVSFILTCILVITANSAHHLGCCSNRAMLHTPRRQPEVAPELCLS